MFDAASAAHRERLRQVLDEGREVLGDSYSFEDMRSIRSVAVLANNVSYLSVGPFGTIIRTDLPYMVTAYLERAHHETVTIIGFGYDPTAGVMNMDDARSYYLLHQEEV